MKIERKSLPKSIVELILEENSKNIAKYRKQVITYLETNTEVKGFRKWSKIPENILVKHYWEEHINKMTIDYAIDWLYKLAIKKENIIPIAQAEIKEIISESPLIIRIHIEVFPSVKIDNNYKDIKIKKEILSVSDEEVENVLKDIQTKFTKFEEVTDNENKVKMWDRVNIDTDWYEWDELLLSTSMKDYPLIIGSNILVPGFEEGMVWAKLWDNLELDIKFPDNYHNEEFKWKNTKFKINIKKFEKAIIPEFTHEFIEQLRWKKLDFNWFKELIKKEILENKESNSRLSEESKLIDELLKFSKIDLWDNIIKNQINKIFSEIIEKLTNEWIKPSDYFESIKLSEDDFKEIQVKPIAIKRLQWELILHKLAEIEKYEISEEEVNEEINKILEKFSSEDVLKKLKDLYVPWNKYYEELKQRIIYRKLIDSFLEE